MVPKLELKLQSLVFIAWSCSVAKKIKADYIFCTYCSSCMLYYNTSQNSVTKELKARGLYMYTMYLYTRIPITYSDPHKIIRCNACLICTLKTELYLPIVRLYSIFTLEKQVKLKKYTNTSMCCKIASYKSA